MSWIWMLLLSVLKTDAFLTLKLKNRVKVCRKCLIQGASSSLAKDKLTMTSLWAGDDSDRMWDEAADRLVSGKGGEVFVKGGGLSEMAASAEALEAEEEAIREQELTSTTRSSTARNAISGMTESSYSTKAAPPLPPKAEKSSDAASSWSSSTAEERSPSPLPLPFMEASSIGIVGKWKEQAGNFVLKPDAESSYNKKSSSNKGASASASAAASTTTALRPPLGVIHFLGGAFVGAAPHLTYRYLLEGLADAGYIVVATPYRLNFDYVDICDDVLSKFDGVAVGLAAEYGAIPVIGVGHSCGALLQTIITSLFPDAPRAANVLISFNNRPAKEAIPAFDELIVPLSAAVLGTTTTTGEGNTTSNSGRVRAALNDARGKVDGALQAYARSSLSPKFVGKELLPLLNQGLELVDQVPAILQAVADGEREFSPSPKDTKEACRRMYRARSTLLIKFEDDGLDESEEAESTLREANTIMRMKRPMVEMDVTLKVVKGTHLTPLAQTFIPGTPEGAPEALKGILDPVRDSVRASPFLHQTNEVKAAILSFLGDSIGKVAASRG